MAALRIDGPDKPGACHRMLSQVAGAGINVRGVSASAAGRKCVVFLAFDSAGDANEAAKVLRKL